MEKWREVWREGLAPHLSKKGLKCLEQALISDDSRLLQGATCYPPFHENTSDQEVQAACALGFCVWQGDGENTVREVEFHFNRLCDLVDFETLGVAPVRHFLDWYDDTPRAEMRRELLREISALRDDLHTNV